AVATAVRFARASVVHRRMVRPPCFRSAKRTRFGAARDRRAPPPPEPRELGVYVPLVHDRKGAYRSCGEQKVTFRSLQFRKATFRVRAGTLHAWTLSPPPRSVSDAPNMLRLRRSCTPLSARPSGCAK